MGFEPTTSSLEGWRSTVELLLLVLINLKPVLGVDSLDVHAPEQDDAFDSDTCDLSFRHNSEQLETHHDTWQG